MQFGNAFVFLRRFIIHSTAAAIPKVSHFFFVLKRWVLPSSLSITSPKAWAQLYYFFTDTECHWSRGDGERDSGRRCDPKRRSKLRADLSLEGGFLVSSLSLSPLVKSRSLGNFSRTTIFFRHGFLFLFTPSALALRKKKSLPVLKFCTYAWALLGKKQGSINFGFLPKSFLSFAFFGNQRAERNQASSIFSMQPTYPLFTCYSHGVKFSSQNKEPLDWSSFHRAADRTLLWEEVGEKGRREEMHSPNGESGFLQAGQHGWARDRWCRTTAGTRGIAIVSL